MPHHPMPIYGPYPCPILQYTKRQHLRFDGAHLLYTDGSKCRSSLAASVYQTRTNQEWLLKLAHHDGQLNTSLRAELAAILYAVQSIPPMEEITFLTDSLTSLQLINNMLSRPQGLRHHKHRRLLSELAQLLWSRQAPVTAHKVRAHIGCSGNERADRLAQAAHTSPTAISYTPAPEPGRGPFWLQYPMPSPSTGDPQMWNTDNLRHHPAKIAAAAHSSTLLTTSTSHHIQAINAMLTGSRAASAPPTAQPVPLDSGILILPSTAFLRPPTAGHTRLTHKRCRTALRIRYAPNLRTKRANSEACPLCAADINSLMHQCGACKHPHVHAIICLRHGYAVHEIALAIKQGTFGDAYLYMDAEGHQRFPRNAANVPALPTWVCPVTPSKPDVVLFPTISTCTSEAALHGWGPAERFQHSIILLEVSFTRDTNLHQRAVDKCEQHSILRQSLLQHDWGIVTVFPLIIGHSGTIPTTFSTALPQCGVEAARLTGLLTDLHYAAIEYSSDVLSAHYRATKRLCVGSPPAPVPMPIVPRPLPATRTRAIRRPARFVDTTTPALATIAQSNVVFYPGGVS